MTSVRQRMGWVAIALGMACGGCADPSAPSGSEEKARVTGVVRRQGKPVSGGTIAFNPANVSRKMATTNEAQIQPDGSYTVETLVGGNRVNVFPTPAEARKLLREAKAHKTALGATGPGGFRGRLDVKSGTNAYDVEM